MTKSKSKPSVILGIGASVSAFKGVEVLRLLVKSGLDVWVCPSQDSLRFVGAATWEAISGHPVHVDGFDEANTIKHVSLAKQAQAFILVAASADLMARFRMGLGDELLTLISLSADCPRFIAPAMHPSMWKNPATQDNVKVLTERGWKFIGPEAGFLVDNTEGRGRLSEPETIVSTVLTSMGWES